MAVWPLPRITFRALSSVQETRRVALLTTEHVWQMLGTQLTLPILIQAEPERYDRDLFDYLAGHLPSTVEAIYAVGNGAPVEAAKVIAAHNGLPLVIVPTVLDSMHMLTPYAVIDEPVNGRQRRVHLETGPATEVIIDWDILLAGPQHLRGAAIVDVLSIVTGLLDWRYAAQKGKNPRAERFRPWTAGVATDLAKQAIKSAAAIGQGDRDALATLLNLMLVAGQLNNGMNHTRVQQGGEHFLADMLATTSYAHTPHAELVGPCLLFVAALHGQDPAPLREAMENAHVRLDQVRATDFNLLLDNLTTHLADHAFPFSILNDLDPVSDLVIQALETAGLAILPETWELPEETQPVTETPVEVAGEHESGASEEAEIVAKDELAVEEPAVEEQVEEETDEEYAPETEAVTETDEAEPEGDLDVEGVAHDDEEPDTTQPASGSADVPAD